MHSRIDDNNLGNDGSQRAPKASRHSAIVFYYFSYERSSLVRAFDCMIGSFFLSFFTVTRRSVATHLCSFGWWKLLSVLSNGYIAFVVDVATRSSLKVTTRYQQPVNEDRPIGVQYRQFSNDWRRCRVALTNPTLPWKVETQWWSAWKLKNTTAEHGTVRFSFVELLSTSANIIWTHNKRIIAYLT